LAKKRQKKGYSIFSFFLFVRGRFFFFVVVVVVAQIKSVEKNAHTIFSGYLLIWIADESQLAVLVYLVFFVFRDTDFSFLKKLS